MDKKIIKDHLIKRFLSEEVTPGIAVTNKVKKDNAKINKYGVKDEAKDSLDYNKSLKQDEDTSKMAQNKFNYADDFQKEYHDQMEIMNGLEMIQYDSMPEKSFTERAIEAIEGSTRMGNNPEWANVYPKEKGFEGPEFGKNLVKKIKKSIELRGQETSALSLRGRDIQEIPAEAKTNNGSKPSSYDNGVIPGKKSGKNLKESEKGADITEMNAPSPISEKLANALKINIEKYGSEKTAEKLIDAVSETKMVSSLPDSIEYGEGLNKISHLLSNGNLEKAVHIAKALAKKIEKKAMKGMFENNKENNNPQIKESMKRLKFKSEFNGLGNALKLIPESYRVDNKTFEMTDGNETYRIRWEGNLSDGKAVVLTASDKKLVNEDIKRMKELFGYKSQDTLGLVKGNARINENKVFGDIWDKSKALLNEEELESTGAKEGHWDETSKKAPEATKHVEGKTSNDKGTSAPKAKEGDANKAVSQAPEAKKHMSSPTKTSEKAKEGHWDEVEGGEKMMETESSTPKESHESKLKHAPEAKKHVHLKENEMEEESMQEETMEDEALMKEIEEDMMKYEMSKHNMMEEEEEEEEEGHESDGEDDDNWHKPESDDFSDEKEPTAADIKKTGATIGTETDGDEDEEDEEDDDFMVSNINKGNLKLLQSPSTGEYWIDNNGIKSKVPDMYLKIASDKTKKGAQKAAIILKKMKADDYEY